MNKNSFDFNKIENFVLAPGDIYWLKATGEELLISKKGEILNTILCQKLKKHNHVLRIENEINIDLILRIEDYFFNSKREMLISKKNIYRKKIIDLIRVEFAEKDRNQNELDMLVWRVFSRFTITEQNEFITLDIDLFKRSLRVTSSMVLSAFLIGYYDEKFLEAIFTKTIKMLVMDAPDQTKKFISDPMSLNSEVSAWEKLLIAYNLHYPQSPGLSQVNILHKLFKGKVSIMPLELRAVLKSMNLAQEISEVAA